MPEAPKMPENMETYVFLLDKHKENEYNYNTGCNAPFCALYREYKKNDKAIVRIKQEEEIIHE